jgi:hypothetical protein
MSDRCRPHEADEDEVRVSLIIVLEHLASSAFHGRSHGFRPCLAEGGELESSESCSGAGWSSGSITLIAGTFDRG